MCIPSPVPKLRHNPGNRTVLVLGSLTLSTTERAMQFHKNDYYINPMLMYRLTIHVLGKDILKYINMRVFQLKHLMAVRAFFMSCIMIRISGKIFNRL